MKADGVRKYCEATVTTLRVSRSTILSGESSCGGGAAGGVAGGQAGMREEVQEEEVQGRVRRLEQQRERGGSGKTNGG